MQVYSYKMREVSTSILLCSAIRQVTCALVKCDEFMLHSEYWLGYGVN
jgi:hypothetical protein